MTTSPRARPVNPAILAFVVGCGLPFLLGACALLLSRLYPESSCSHYTGCIGNFLEAWEIMRWTGLAVAWPMLAFLGVRRAWRVAVAGDVLLVLLWHGATWATIGHFSLFAQIFGGVITYPVAVWLIRTTARR